MRYRLAILGCAKGRSAHKENAIIGSPLPDSRRGRRRHPVGRHQADHDEADTSSGDHLAVRWGNGTYSSVGRAIDVLAGPAASTAVR